jgi:hypothetical protein
MLSRKVESQIDLAMKRALSNLTAHEVHSDEYAKMLDQVVKLHKMKEEEKTSVVSKDTLVIVGANLLSVVMIIRHENVNTIMSRAMNLLLKA